MARNNDEPKPSTVLITLRLCAEHEATRQRRAAGQPDGSREGTRQEDYLAARLCTILMYQERCCTIKVDVKGAQ